MAFAVLINPVHADAFLDIIKQEVHAVELDPVTQKSKTGSKAVKAPGKKPEQPGNKGQDIPAGMTHQEFESHLERRYVGSFSFYRRLSPEKKTSVYQAYREQPRMQYIRDKIKQTYLNQ